MSFFSFQFLTEGIKYVHVHIELSRKQKKKNSEFKIAKIQIFQNSYLSLKSYLEKSYFYAE